MKYPSRTLVKNISPVARSVSEANRDAQYCCAIQTFKSDAKLTIAFVVDALFGALITASIVSPFVVGFYVWSKL
jgi:hypothetical protein